MEQEQMQQQEEKKKPALPILYIILGVGIASLCVSIAVGVWTLTSGNAPKSLAKENVIEISGTGKVKRTPNKAVVHITATKTAPTESEAQQKLSDATKQLLDALREYGVEEKDLKTTNYSIYEDYTTEEAVSAQPTTSVDGVMYSYPEFPQTKTVQRASHDIEITVHDAEGIEKKANDIAKIIPSVPDVKFSSIQFTLEDEDKETAEMETQQEALGKAEEKAKSLAENSGRKLGKMLVINESPNDDNFLGSLYSAASALSELTGGSSASPSLQASEIEISSTIFVTFELK